MSVRTLHSWYNELGRGYSLSESTLSHFLLSTLDALLQCGTLAN